MDSCVSVPALFSGDGVGKRVRMSDLFGREMIYSRALLAKVSNVSNSFSGYYPRGGVHVGDFLAFVFSYVSFAFEAVGGCICDGISAGTRQVYFC